MKLVRFGHRVFNMALLVEAKIFKDEVQLRFAAPEGCWEPSEGTINPYYERLTGRDAIAFTRWVEDIADNARASIE